MSLSLPERNASKARIQIQRVRIDACDTLLDYLHDDVAWKDQQPLQDMLRQLKHDFESEMTEAFKDE